MSDQKELELNKEIANRLCVEVFQNFPPRLETIDELVHEDYIQHNPYAGQGRKGLREFAEGLLTNSRADLDRVNASEFLGLNLIAEGDLVVRHEIRKDWMLVDVFRCRDGLLVEHWDAFRWAPGVTPLPGF